MKSETLESYWNPCRSMGKITAYMGTEGMRSMDAVTINTLTSNVIAVLAPFLTKAGEELAKQAGKAETDKISALYQSLKARLKNHPTTAEALTDLGAAPDDEDAHAVLRLQLKKQLTTDPGFADRLRQMLGEIHKSFM